MAESTRQEWLGMPTREGRPEHNQREMTSLLTLSKDCHQMATEEGETNMRTLRNTLYILLHVYEINYTQFPP